MGSLTLFQCTVSAVQPFYKKGAVKGVKHMKGKWQNVSFVYLLLIKLSLTSHKLKSLFRCSDNKTKFKNPTVW